MDVPFLWVSALSVIRGWGGVVFVGWIWLHPLISPSCYEGLVVCGFCHICCWRVVLFQLVLRRFLEFLVVGASCLRCAWSLCHIGSHILLCYLWVHMGMVLLLCCLFFLFKFSLGTMVFRGCRLPLPRKTVGKPRLVVVAVQGAPGLTLFIHVLRRIYVRHQERIKRAIYDPRY